MATWRTDPVPSTNASDLEKEEAEDELAKITKWARQNRRGTEGGEHKQVRAIRQAIRRLIDRLSAAKNESKEPHRVLRAFAEHLERYLWKPSALGGPRRSARVRGKRAGRFTYEPPAGVRWG